MKEKKFHPCFLLIGLIVAFILNYSFVMPRVLLVSDSNYKESTIDPQLGKIRLTLFFKGLSLQVLTEDEISNTWKQAVRERDHYVVLSPSLSYGIKKASGNYRLISLSSSIQDAYLVAQRSGDMAAWTQLGTLLASENKSVYLIDSSEWRPSVPRSDAFIAGYQDSHASLVRKQLSGEATSIIANTISYEIQTHSYDCLVCPGSLILSQLHFLDETPPLFYLSADQFQSVEREAIGGVIGDDLPAFFAHIKEGQTLLPQHFMNRQEGLKNFVQLGWSNLKAKLF